MRRQLLKKPRRENKRKEREEELDDVFKQLKKKHGSDYSGPQLRLWARMFVANTHDDLEYPPNVPLITGSVQRQTCKESPSQMLQVPSQRHFLHQPLHHQPAFRVRLLILE